jgi:hypothetical protein
MHGAIRYAEVAGEIDDFDGARKPIIEEARRGVRTHTRRKRQEYD